MFSIPKPMCIAVPSYAFLSTNLVPPPDVQVLSVFMYFFISLSFLLTLATFHFLFFFFKSSILCFFWIEGSNLWVLNFWVLDFQLKTEPKNWLKALSPILLGKMLRKTNQLINSLKDFDEARVIR